MNHMKMDPERDWNDCNKINQKSNDKSEQKSNVLCEHPVFPEVPNLISLENPPRQQDSGRRTPNKDKQGTDGGRREPSQVRSNTSSSFESGEAFFGLRRPAERLTLVN